MKNSLMLRQEKIICRKHSQIETVNEYLKNIFQIEDTRYRSLNNFIRNL